MERRKGEGENRNGEMRRRKRGRGRGRNEGGGREERGGRGRKEGREEFRPQSSFQKSAPMLLVLLLLSHMNSQKVGYSKTYMLCHLLPNRTSHSYSIRPCSLTIKADSRNFITGQLLKDMYQLNIALLLFFSFLSTYCSVAVCQLIINMMMMTIPIVTNHLWV